MVAAQETATTYIQEIAYAIARNTYAIQAGEEAAEKEWFPHHLKNDWNRLFLHFAVLCRAKGRNTTAEDVHDARSAFAMLHNPAQPYIVPYAEATPEAQEETRIFRDAIHRASVLSSA